MPCSNHLKSFLNLDTRYILEVAALRVRVDWSSPDSGRHGLFPVRKTNVNDPAALVIIGVGTGPSPGGSARLVFSRLIRFHCKNLRCSPRHRAPYAPLTIFPAHSERSPARGRDRFAPPDAAGGDDAAGGRRHLCLPAARAAGCG